ncbi:MAG: hypothetical protein PUC47_04425 [Oscillospiraceae bacterium]|nr:hypothetical protein [Oscillospiraceae bacterium]
MKMQVLYIEKKEGVQESPEIIATKIAREYKCKGDKIPPAYPCEQEKLVILCFETYGSLDKRLIAFCKDLSTSRASNVALVMINKDGNNTVPAALADIFKQNGVNVAGACGIAIKKSLFGKGKPTEEDLKKAVEFADAQINALFDTVG